MKIYYSIDPEATGEASLDASKKLMNFLQEQGHILYRATYMLSEDPDLFLQKELGLDRKPTYSEQRDAHMKWIDDSDLLLADISAPSEGRSMIIQRALDKPKMGLNKTAIILIKENVSDRHFGKIIKGLIENEDTVYFEYSIIDDVIKKWKELLTNSKLNSS